MNNLKIYTIILLAFASAASLKADPIPTFEIEEKLSDNAPYFKFGICPLHSDLGVGFRRHHCALDFKKAEDHSINLFCPHVPDLGCLVTYKYSHIKYRNSSSNKYMGVGFELGVGVLEWDRLFAPIPNIELIFGRDYGKGSTCKWGQLGINLLPVAIGVYGLIEDYRNPYIAIVEGIIAMSAVTYTWAF